MRGGVGGGARVKKRGGGAVAERVNFVFLKSLSLPYKEWAAAHVCSGLPQWRPLQSSRQQTSLRFGGRSPVCTTGPGVPGILGITDCCPPALRACGGTGGGGGGECPKKTTDWLATA